MKRNLHSRIVISNKTTRFSIPRKNLLFFELTWWWYFSVDNFNWHPKAEDSRFGFPIEHFPGESSAKFRVGFLHLHLVLVSVRCALLNGTSESLAAAGIAFQTWVRKFQSADVSGHFSVQFSCVNWRCKVNL